MMPLPPPVIAINQLKCLRPSWFILPWQLVRLFPERAAPWVRRGWGKAFLPKIFNRHLCTTIPSSPLTVSACPPWPCLCFFGSFIKFSSGIRSRIFFCLLPVFLLLFSQEENFIVNFRIMHNNNTTTDGSWEKKQQPFAASDYLRHFVARKLRWVPHCRIAQGDATSNPDLGTLGPPNSDCCYWRS